MKGNYPSVIPF